jgi:uncharacterized protein (TIGR02598 family)
MNRVDNPYLQIRPSRRADRGGFSLTEVMLSLGLVTFCLVGLLGLFPVGLSQDRTSTDQTRAAHILEAVADTFRGQMRIPLGVTATTSPTNRFSLQIPAVGTGPAEGSFIVDENGSLSARSEPDSYVVHYSIQAPAATDGAFKPYQMRIIVAWPGTAEFQGSGTSLALLKFRGNLNTSLEINRE